MNFTSNYSKVRLLTKNPAWLRWAVKPTKSTGWRPVDGNNKEIMWSVRFMRSNGELPVVHYPMWERR